MTTLLTFLTSISSFSIHDAGKLDPNDLLQQTDDFYTNILPDQIENPSEITSSPSIPANGSCFFLSVLNELPNRDLTSSQLRRVVVRHLRQNRELYEPFVTVTQFTDNKRHTAYISVQNQKMHQKS